MGGIVRPTMSSYTGYLVETLVTLVLVCAVAFAVLYGARRLGAFRPSGPVKLVGSLPLPREGGRAVYLVQVGEQVYVVAAGEGGFTKLGEVPAASLPQTPETKPRFVEVLDRTFSRGARVAASPPEPRPSEEDPPT